MKPFRWNYGALRPLDFCFMRAASPVGAVIRAVTGGEVNHCGILVDLHGQLMVEEMTGRGCVLTSLEHYNGSLNQVVHVVRYTGWAGLEEDTLRWLAEVHRRSCEPRSYGWSVLRFWDWWGKAKAPRDKDGTRRMYCSELCTRAFVRGKPPGMPSLWCGAWPSPVALYVHQHRRSDCNDVVFKVSRLTSNSFPVTGRKG